MPLASSPSTELYNMDRLTQLQDAIDRLLTIMQHSIAYLTERTDFRELNPDAPVGTVHRNADEPEEFEANQKELVEDLVSQAKQIEMLIDSLPLEADQEEQADRFEALQKEMELVNSEYVQVLERARQLRAEINDVLQLILKCVETPAEAPHERPAGVYA